MRQPGPFGGPPCGFCVAQFYGGHEVGACTERDQYPEVTPDLYPKGLAHHLGGGVPDRFREVFQWGHVVQFTVGAGGAGHVAGVLPLLACA